MAKRQKLAVETFAKQPGYVGLKKLQGNWRMVDDPSGGQIRVKRSIKSPLEYYHDRGKLTAAEYQAGRRYYIAYCIWSGQTGLSLDTTLGGLGTRVQSSGRSEPISERQLEAAETIKRATRALGHIRAYRFQLITGEEWSPRRVAREIDGNVSREKGWEQRDYWIESLRIVAKTYGY